MSGTVVFNSHRGMAKGVDDQKIHALAVDRHPSQPPFLFFSSDFSVVTKAPSETSANTR